ncbi:hypothetical protein YC2023_072633 [Brassica napus]
MSSKRKSSTKSHHDRSVPDGSCSQHVDVVPKVEFSADSIDPEENDAYWAARGELNPPVPGLWVPSPFKANHVVGCPSRSFPNELAAIRPWKIRKYLSYKEKCLSDMGSNFSSHYNHNHTFNVFLSSSKRWISTYKYVSSHPLRIIFRIPIALNIYFVVLPPSLPLLRFFQKREFMGVDMILLEAESSECQPSCSTSMMMDKGCCYTCCSMWTEASTDCLSLYLRDLQ